MELTLDQALQKGIEAHKAGRVQEADRCYTAILKANPKHPDANHNMGVLAVGIGKVEVSLQFFKTALEVNPSIAQYWQSYIDALIKLDRLTDAEEVFDQAKQYGTKDNELDKLEILLKKGWNGQQRLGQPEKLPMEKLQSLKKLYNQNQLEQVFNEAQKLTQRYTKSLSLWNLMGASAAQIGQLEKAVFAFKKAIDIKPNSAELYFNMGHALKNKGNLSEAIKAYNKATSLKPANAYTYNNIGNVLKDLGKLEKAAKAYMKAIAIKPDYSEAYYNMGNVLKDLGKLEKAAKAYMKAIAIKPDFSEAYNNLGITLQDQGKSGSAIEAYKKALLLTPEYAEVWNNIYFPLKTINFKKRSDKNLHSLYLENKNSNDGRIELGILDYRLHRGQENEEIYLDRVMKSLASAKNITIKNHTFNVKSSEKSFTFPNEIVALVHFGRSGTGLMHSLIDSHPQISTLPSIYFKEYFDHSTWMRIISDGWDGIIDNFVELYDVLFEATSSTPIASKSKTFIQSIGISDGMANVGSNRNDVLSLNKKIFVSELRGILALYDEIDASVFFKLVHTAYNKVLNDNNSKKLIFYHIHNPDKYAKLNFVRFNPQANWLVMVREPIQSCEAWIRDCFAKNDYFGMSVRIITMLFDIDNSVYTRQRSIGIRLEDLKNKPRKTVPALCKWMGIEENESLYEMTAQGKKWWGDPSSPDYLKDGMEPFGKTSIKRKTGSIFSENDQFILRTLFFPFSVRFGYAKENVKQYRVDLAKIRPMIDDMFDFERKYAEKMKVSCEKLKTTGTYMYFRSRLIERWNTLNKLGTYPNMIVPLKI